MWPPPQGQAACRGMPGLAAGREQAGEKQVTCLVACNACLWTLYLFIPYRHPPRATYLASNKQTPVALNELLLGCPVFW